MNAIIRSLAVLWEAKIQLHKFLLVLGGVSLTALIFVQVISRYVFDTAIFGIEEIASYVSVWFYFIGCSLGAANKEHISASLVNLFLQGHTAKLIMAIFTNIISTILSGWMAVWAFGLASWSLKMGMMSTELQIPIGLIQLAMPVGLSLMTLYFFAELIENILLLNKHQQGPTYD